MARIEQSIDVNVPLSAAYNQWTQFEQFPRFMEGVMEVRQLDDAHLHWRVQRHGREMEWDSEIVDQVPDQSINWRDTSGPQHSGSITFQPLQQDQTRIRMTMEFEPSADPAASAAQEIAERVGQDLERFKSLVEKQGVSGAWRGEIHAARTSAQPPDMQSKSGGESVGKTIGQTAQEQQAGSASNPSGRWEGWTDASALDFQANNDGVNAALDGESVGGAPDNGGSTSTGNSTGSSAGSSAGSSTGSSAGSTGSSSQARQNAAGAGEGRGSGAGPQSWLRNQFPALEEPIGMMRRVTEEMDQLFDRFIGRPIAARFGQGQGGMAGKWMPQVEVIQQEDALLVCVDLPGVKREDVQIALLHDRLTLEGERHEQSGGRTAEGYRRSERCYGRFYRMIPLPHGVDPDHATAAMREGVLEIRIPMPAAARKARQVDIQPPG